MARVTVEDCMKVIPSRFELVVLAAQRAREISCGAKSAVDKDNKDAVISLREIAMGQINPDVLRESIVKKNQNRKFIVEEDNIDMADDGFSGDEIAENLAEMSSSINQTTLAAFEDELEGDSYSEEESVEELLDEEITDDE